MSGTASMPRPCGSDRDPGPAQVPECSGHLAVIDRITVTWRSRTGHDVRFRTASGRTTEEDQGDFVRPIRDRPASRAA